MPRRGRFRSPEGWRAGRRRRALCAPARPCSQDGKRDSLAVSRLAGSAGGRADLERLPERRDGEGRRARAARELRLGRAPQALHHARHGPEQGKTSSVNGLAPLAHVTGRAIGKVGARPIGRPSRRRHPSAGGPARQRADRAGAAAAAGNRASPRRRRAQEYGGWLRPAYYDAGPAAAAIREEATRARQSAAISTGRRSARSR